MAALTYGNLDLPFFIFFIVTVLPSASSVYFKMPRTLIYVVLVGPFMQRGYRSGNSHTGKLSDFTTQFSFSIDTLGRTPYGHGLAFFLAPVGFQIPPNSVCGYLGLFNATTAYSSANQIVMVEFDSFPNPEWDPPDVQDHVGINNNSIASAVYTRWNASFHSGDTADARISYNATTKNLSVSWTYRRTANSNENTSLFYIIDLMQVLPEWVTIGFSAASGENGQRFILQSWEFNSNLDIKETKKTIASKKRTIVVATISLFVVVVGTNNRTNHIIEEDES
ncbi:hypothetical protein Patl1_28380 [Pistacia atlantica]|uniref:Uncharacterized protein n=1 Tax=Pistacia atlantica TaxID=434234 RepID=A0ACC1BDC4_9ROSI|nr:hypothetical protein Patl1_28380 [Pistacia atlantica]